MTISVIQEHRTQLLTILMTTQYIKHNYLFSI